LLGTLLAQRITSLFCHRIAGNMNARLDPPPVATRAASGNVSNDAGARCSMRQGNRSSKQAQTTRLPLASNAHRTRVMRSSGPISFDAST
jgi:hypothetical protein